MRDKEKVQEELDNFIGSDYKNCLVIGTNWQKKHKNIIQYLYKINKKLKILIRIPTMQDSEYIIGVKAKTGIPIYFKNLTIYVDSFQTKSQEKTHRNFNCILVYPVDSLKGATDNNIDDILNHRNSEKIFWISNHDGVDYSYLKLICNITHIIEINNSDDEIHKRILDNTSITERESLDKLYVKDLSYHYVEEAVDKQYTLGGVYTSGGFGQELLEGSYGCYTFGGHRATKKIMIKVLEQKENDMYALLTKLSK